MKGLAILSLLMWCVVAAPAQVGEEKKTEVGFSGGYVNYSQGSSSQSTGLLVLSPRVGVFVVEGLELEAEVMAAFPSNGDPAYLINGNLAYNVPLQKRALGFFLVGYGFGNAVPILNVPGIAYRQTTLGVLNLGGGIKVRASDDVAVRVEFRYQKFTGKQAQDPILSYVPPGENRTIDVRVVSVLAGFSLFF